MNKTVEVEIDIEIARKMLFVAGYCKEATSVLLEARLPCSLWSSFRASLLFLPASPADQNQNNHCTAGSICLFYGS